MTESTIRSIREDFDWSSLRFPGERTLRAEIESDEVLAPLITEYCNPQSMLPIEFLRGGLRVGPAVTPALHRVALLVQQVLQIPRPIQLEVVPFQLPRVEIPQLDRMECVLLRISSGLVADAELRETLFWLGRKVGQVLLGQWPMFGDPSQGNMDEGRETLLLRGLWRFQELACDRFGLLCCQSEESAVRALVRQVSGLPGDLVAVAREEWLKDRISEEDAMISPNESDFLLLRVAALTKFADSARYQQAFHGPPIEEQGISPPRPAKSMLEPKEASNLPPAPPTPTAASIEYLQYLPIAGDPSVVEQVSRPAPSKEPGPAVRTKEAAPVPMSREGELAIRRSFAVAGAFWILSLFDQVTPRQRSMVADLYGEEVFDEVRSLYKDHGIDGFVQRARIAAARLKQMDRAFRFDVVKELGRVALTDSRDLARSEPVLDELVGMLDLSRDDLNMALADYVDSEYADYVFQMGEAVDVHLDGEWVTGAVESIDPSSGEVKVRFGATGKPLRLHPVSDWIRPHATKRAS